MLSQVPVVNNSCWNDMFFIFMAFKAIITGIICADFELSINHPCVKQILYFQFSFLLPASDLLNCNRPFYPPSNLWCVQGKLCQSFVSRGPYASDKIKSIIDFKLKFQIKKYILNYRLPSQSYKLIIDN